MESWDGADSSARDKETLKLARAQGMSWQPSRLRSKTLTGQPERAGTEAEARPRREACVSEPWVTRHKSSEKMTAPVSCHNLDLKESSPGCPAMVWV